MGPLGSSGVVLRDKAAVEQLLFSLREYYSLTGAEEGAAEREKRVKVRSYILLVVKQFITTVCIYNGMYIQYSETVSYIWE